MNAAQQIDERDREIRRLTKAVEKVLPNPLSLQQKVFLENVLVLNLNGEA